MFLRGKNTFNEHNSASAKTPCKELIKPLQLD